MDVKSIRRPAGGRPRLLTQDQVVESALRIGLEGFTMKRVASDLGVSIATLYQYVGDRDELLRLAVAKQMTSLTLPPDRGQHWSEYLEEYMKTLLDSVATDPHVLVRLIVSGSDIESEIAVIEDFLGFMESREFAPREAMQIMRQASAIALGVAAAVSRDRARAARTNSLAQAIRQAIVKFPPEEVVRVRAAEKDYAAPSEDLAWELLRQLIRSIADRRGETLTERKPRPNNRRKT